MSASNPFCIPGCDIGCCSVSKIILFVIGHIQISQVPDRNEPGANGEINYTFVFNHLLRIGYSGWIGCEYVPKGILKQAFDLTVF